MNYRIFASLQQEIDSGWVWLLAKEFPSRCIVNIRSKRTRKQIFCEALQIDDNFLNIYNTSTARHKIEDPETALVINAWYRKNLGDITTQSHEDLHIIVSNGFFSKLRASLGHPQIAIRVGTWLGIISVGLGAMGFIMGAVLALLA